MFLDASWAPARRPGGAQGASRTGLERARRSPGRVQEARITKKIGVRMPSQFGERLGEVFWSIWGRILDGFFMDLGFHFEWVFDIFSGELGQKSIRKNKRKVKSFEH